MLLTALEHLERKILRFLQIISIAIGRGLEKSKMEELLNLISLLVQDYPSTVNKLLVVNFFTNIDLFYYVGQHLTYCSGKIEINEMIKNIKHTFSRSPLFMFIIFLSFLCFLKFIFFQKYCK